MALPKTVNCLLSFISRTSPVHSHERQTFKGLCLENGGPVGDRRQKWKRKVFSPWRVARTGTPSLSDGGGMSRYVSTDYYPLRYVFKVLTMRKSLCDSADCDGQTGKGKARTLPPSCAYCATVYWQRKSECGVAPPNERTHHSYTHTHTQASPCISVKFLLRLTLLSVESQRSRIICVRINVKKTLLLHIIVSFSSAPFDSFW